MLARAFAAEGVDGAVHPDGRRKHVLVVGDGQAARRQGGACATRALRGLDGRRLYARATGKVGVGPRRPSARASREIMTALTIAARGRRAAGGIRGRFVRWPRRGYIPQRDMAPLALATGATTWR